MSQHGHDNLMESGSPNEAITASTPSPPRRDPVEDADSTLTRKRPRLDSGSGIEGPDQHNMTACPLPSADTSTPPPADQLVEMTIRSQQPSSPTPADEPSSPSTVANDDEEQVTPGEDDTAQPVMASTESDMVCDYAAPSDSPPVIAIDDDEGDPSDNAVDGYSADYIRMVHDEENYFMQFPFAGQYPGYYMGALGQMITHFQGAQPLDGNVLPNVTLWLVGLPDGPTYYYDKLAFWDQFGSFVNRVLNRKHPFGDGFAQGHQTEEEIFYTFFKAYVEVCARLFHLDADILSSSSADEFPDENLLSLKHVRALYNILRPDKPAVFSVLSKEYAVDVHEMGDRLIIDFLEEPTNGPQHLLEFADAVCRKASANAKSFMAVAITQLISLLGCRLHDSRHVQGQGIMTRAEFRRGALRFFWGCNGHLQSAHKVVDVSQTRDLVYYLGVLLSDLCQWHDEAAIELARGLLHKERTSSAAEPTDSVPDRGLIAFQEHPRDRHILVSDTWKLKLLIKYVVKGRMELRVMSIATMDAALVALWKRYNESTAGARHPVMQYFADFLLDEKVVDYIISVDSHPQIISRSGNIVGFLVVTNRYSVAQTDAIWRTISNSQDPRVVSATFTMLRIIMNLMDASDLLYLCSKLFGLAIGSYSLETLRFVYEIYDKLEQKRFYDWKSTDVSARPWNVSIRIIQDTPPSIESTKLSLDLHHVACQQLEHMAGAVGPQEREQIYTDCARLIADRSPKATGSIRALHIFCSKGTYSEASFFRQHPDISRQILEELCFFVKSQNQQGYYPLYPEALNYRLEMLRFLVLRALDSIPADLYSDIWDHIIGKYALNNQIRDQAWLKLAEIVKLQPDNGFSKQLISAYVPQLEPEFFTQGMFDFVASYNFPITRQKVSTGEGELLQIRGADLLWQLVMTAPQGTIENRAAELLASRYVEIDRSQKVTVQELENAHVALVEKCTAELLSAYRSLRGVSAGGPSEREHVDAGEYQEPMEITTSDSARQQIELRFCRTALFEKLLLRTIRTKPEFCRARPSESDSDVQLSEPTPNHGDIIQIRYNGENTANKQALSIGTENTLQDLETRICDATGFTKVNLFYSGQKLNVSENAEAMLSEFKLAPNAFLLVQKAAGSQTRQPLSDDRTGCSVFETAVLNHFEDLFSCMDSDDRISAVLFDLFISFPYRESIASDVSAGTAKTDSIFPPGKPFQAKYAAYALRHRLKEQLRRSTLDEAFMLHAVQILDKAILNRDLLNESFSKPNEIPDLITVLLEFLKERPGQDVSLCYFSDPSSLVNRLMKILSLALQAPSDNAAVACNAYATILEASLHSREIWEAFTTRPDNVELHKALLLEDPRKPLRERIIKSIASVCGGDLPATSPLSKTETASRFWTIISAVLPLSLGHAAQSEQLFEIAEQVFRSHDENSRDEASLRSCLFSWGELLLQYNHEESVGRDEIDHVVLGLTKLLLSCVSSLKSFKKSLNAGTLAEQIFRKYLFVPRVTEIDEVISQDVGLPVLESKTRKELYDLLLALTEDRDSYDTLLNLCKGLSEDEETRFARPYGMERTDEIRSATGYVGLLNPRALCYMNSLLTQLFMNVNFRKFMLGLDVADPESSQRLLSETQHLFARMQNTFRKSADPREFAASVKGIEGLPIDVSVQMDADEFYNLLFDQWEGQMMSPETRKLFRTFYGGQMIHQIKSKECEHVSERAESFFVVQCDVQGKSNLHESLQAFVEGDVMEGDNKYKCESCGGRFVDAVKRTCLKDVPDNLIFHLKRFDFDLLEMRRAKINDYFSFPEQIDISAYNIDHLSKPSKPRNEDLFELVGVLIHQGTSENGHYYSYIRERPCPSGGMTDWVEFNDRDVDKFDHRTIPSNAYGGPFEDQFHGQQKPFSAYMLFYQRKVSINKDHDEYIRSPNCGNVKVPVPPALEAEIDRDNQLFIREYCLHDPNHSKFVRQILATLRTVNNGTCSEDHEQEKQALHVALEHLCQTVARQKNPEHFEELIIQLRKTVLSCPGCCQAALNWFATHDSAVSGLLLRCPHPKIRSQARAFLVDGLRALRQQDSAAYLGTNNTDTDAENGQHSPSPSPSQGILIDVVRRLRLVGDELWMSSRGWDDYFLTLCQIGRIGLVEIAVLLNYEFLELCLKMLSMHGREQFRNAMPDLWRLVEKKKNIFNRLIELVYVITQHMSIELQPVGSTASGLDRMQFYDRIHSKFPLTQLELECLYIWDDNNRAMAVMDKMIETFDPAKTDIFYPGEFLKWLLESQDRRFHVRISKTVYEGISEISPPFSEPYVRAAQPYCEACYDPELVGRVVDAVAKSGTNLTNLSGEVYLDFLNALPNLQNPALFDLQGPNVFYLLALRAARFCAIPLLLYEDETVRKSTESHLDYLLHHFEPEDAVDPETVRRRDVTIRNLADKMSKKIVLEHSQGSSRAYMQPLINTCTVLMDLVQARILSDDEDLPKYQNDENLVAYWDTEVVPRLQAWRTELSTPISTAGRLALNSDPDPVGTPTDSDSENFEQSDYGSESDDCVEVEQ